MIEAGVLIDLQDRPLYWHKPPGADIVCLPDSRELWDIIWEHRKVLGGFAHSHPGGGIPGPSLTDLTTFAAVEAGLGKRLDWWVHNAENSVLCRWRGPDKLSYTTEIWWMEPMWVCKLRELSGFERGP